MREILFRGFHPCDGPDTIVVDGEKVKGKWVEGYYVERDNKSWIYPASNQIISKSLARELRPFHSAKSTQKIMKEVFPVLPSTVGQYTGLTDRNGKRVFEGNTLKIAKKDDGLGTYFFPPLEYPINVVVKWDMCAWMWETLGDKKYYLSFPDAWCHYECEVIGTVFDEEAHQ